MDHYALAKFADAFEVVPRALAETSGLRSNESHCRAARPARGWMLLRAWI